MKGLIMWHDLEAITPRIDKMFRDNPRRSVSAAFRVIRSSSASRAFGDYPILFLVVRTASSAGAHINREQIRRALCCSDELGAFSARDKRAFLDQLLLTTEELITLPVAV